MAFNIYEWRRNQLLTEGEVSENKAQKVYDTIYDFLSPQYKDNMGKSAVISAISRGLFLEENKENSLEVGKHPKSIISKFDWAYLPGKDKLEATKITKSIIDSLPDELMYTGMQYSKDAQKAIPRFKLAGETKNTGNSMAGYDPKKEEPYIEKRKIYKNI
jgi:hypothetical protein